MRFSPNGKLALVTKQYTPYLLVRDEAVSVEGGSEPLPLGTQTALGDLWLLDLLSGQERQLATGIGRYSWSPDSKQVAYIAPTEDEGIAGSLYVLDIAGGEARQIAPVDFLGSDYTPQWLPTGEIVYVRDGLLWATTAEGGQQKNLPPFKFHSWVAAEAGQTGHQATLEAMTRFRFSPDGERIAYFTRPANNRVIAKRLWLADANGANAQLITEQAEGSYYEWSPNGEWVVFNTFRDVDDPIVDQRDPGLRELWVVRKDGSALRVLHRTDSWRWILSPTWSPDSKLVAFIQAG